MTPSYIIKNVKFRTFKKLNIYGPNASWVQFLNTFTDKWDFNNTSD